MPSRQKKTKLDKARERLIQMGFDREFADKLISATGVEHQKELLDLIKEKKFDITQIIPVWFALINLKDEGAKKRIIELIKEGKIKPEHLYDRFYLFKDVKKEHVDYVANTGIPPEYFTRVVNFMPETEEEVKRAIDLWEKGFIDENSFQLTVSYLTSKKWAVNKLVDLIEKNKLPRNHFPFLLTVLLMCEPGNYAPLEEAVDILKKYKIPEDYKYTWATAIAKNPKLARKLLEKVNSGEEDPNEMSELIINLSSRFQSMSPDEFDKIKDYEKEEIEKKKAWERVMGGSVSGREFDSEKDLQQMIRIYTRSYWNVPPLLEEEQWIVNKGSVDRILRFLKEDIIKGKMIETKIKTKDGTFLIPKRNMISKDELLKVARQKGAYVPELERLIKEEMSYADIYDLIQKLHAMKQSRLPTGSIVRLAVGPAIEEEKYLRKIITLAMFPKNLEGISWDRAIDFPDTLGYVKLYPIGKTLYVINIQSSIFSPHVKVRPSLKKRLKKWAEVLLDAVEEYAKRNGYERVAITPANFQVRRWESINPRVAHELYTELPMKKGYSLKQLGRKDICGVDESIFWVKKISGEGKLSVLKKLEMISRRTRGSKRYK